MVLGTLYRNLRGYFAARWCFALILSDCPDCGLRPAGHPLRRALRRGRIGFTT